MYAEIISNGDELTSGKVLDTNAQWLSIELAAFGITALYHTTVGDDKDAMMDVLKIAMSRTDLVIWTGGLSPTADDLTRQTFADAAGVPLVKDEESLRQIEELFKRRGYGMPAANELQAYQPLGAKPIRNPHGTAPGIDFTVPRQKPIPAGRFDTVRLLAYPGVPAELKEMWNDSGCLTIREMLDNAAGQKRVIKFRVINSFGMGESQVEAKLPDIINRKHIPRVGITASRGTITLRIAAEAPTESQCDALIEPTAQLIYATLGDVIFGEGTDTLPDVVCRKLKKDGKTLAVIEAGTRGLLAEAVAKSPESAGCFLGGVVVPPKTQIAPNTMVELGKKMFDADYLLLVGAYPAGEPDRKRSDETFAAAVDAKQPDLQKAFLKMTNYPFAGHPDIIDDLYVKRAIDMLRRLLV